MAEAGPGERSARRIFVIAAAVLIGAIVAVNLTFIAGGGQRPFPLWYSLLAGAAAVLTLLPAVVVRWLPDRAVRVCGLVAVLLYLSVLLAFPVAASGHGVGRIPWILTASSAAVVMALVAQGRTLAWVTVAAGAAAGIVYRPLFGGFDMDGVVNDLHALLTGAVICVVGDRILSVARGLDRAATETAAAAARASAERGRLAARARASALVHDEILATLNVAATDLPIPHDRVAEQARRAAAGVTRLVDADADERPTLRAALWAEAAQHGAAFREAGRTGSEMPAEVQEPIVAAVRQALGNSVRHAGPDAARTVALVVSDSEIHVEVGDDGVGFDVSAIPHDRLGIRQSIVARMARVPGGSGEIFSTPGRGTRVRLVVQRPAVGGDLRADGQRALRAGLGVIAVMFVIVQVFSAVAAVAAAPSSVFVQAVILAAVVWAAETLRRSPTLVPSRGRVAVVVATVVGAVAVGLAFVPFTYGATWFATAAAFVLVAVALRRRPRIALLGAAVVVTAIVVAGFVAQAPSGQVLQMTVRPIAIVILAAALLGVLGRMQADIAALHAEAVASIEAESWSRAARDELADRVADLARTVVPVLQRLADGPPPTAADRRRFAAQEGELRDSLRAGLLVREPLTAAAAQARARGVDVVLLDDSDVGAADAIVDAVAVWMAARVGEARFRAVGRMLPRSRETWATVAIDERFAEFGPADAPAASVHDGVMSFQGE
ncbi:sensor histidine kinase [Microbacterium sp. cx-59]|uniref:sensor histidine kinase n=1 Tax=Microbacterium sp. cx-59 TaxID=2891207 RepID=UPI001E5E64AB|nr:ATP-binding protein [Microbacterium sp. cx-59]MCC4909252.1 hypothetical protein [Microbacterium sp. cx-59]